MILTRNMERYYKMAQGQVKAVDGLNIDVKPGEFVAVMGPSGSGKSTLLYMLGAMDRPTSGWISVDGDRLDGMNDQQLSKFRNRRIGFVFQSFHLLSRLTLARNVALPMIYAGTPVEMRRSRVHTLLDAVGLADSYTRLPTELSGGQCQRVAIARALVNSPSLLLADEPTGNLDSKTGLDIMGIFQALNDNGMTFVMVTHDENMARHASRIIRMRDGKVVDDEAVRDRSLAKPPAEFRPEMIEVGS